MITGPKPVPLTKIRLDAKNHRFLNPPLSPNQNGLLAKMFDEYETLELATKISTEGYRPLENLVLCPGPDKDFIVLEGNRRVAACTGLRFPNRLPSKYRKLVARLAEAADLGTFRALPSLVCERRVDALPYMVRKHNANDILKWSPLVQSHFYLEALEETGSIAAGAGVLGVSEAIFREQLRLNSLFRYYQTLQDAVVMNNEETALAFNTTLDRVFRTDQVRKYLSYRVNDRGSYEITRGTAELAHLLPKLVAGILDRSLNSRNMNDEDLRIKKLDQLMADFKAPEISEEPPEPEVPPSAGGGETSDRTERALEQARKKRIRTKSRFGLPTNLAHQNPNITSLYRELAVSGTQRPRADVLVLRSLIELCLYEKMRKDELKLWKAERTKDVQKKNLKRKRDGKPELAFDLGTPTLREMLLWVVKPESQIIQDNQVKKALLQQLKEREVMNLLNLPAHNADWTVTSEKAASLVAEFHGFITKELMV